MPDLEHGRGFGRVHGGGSGPSLGRQPLALYNNSVPPLIAHDPLGAAAVAGQPHWAVLLVATLHVAGEPWALALLALAAYSWLEREVRGVVEVVVPLALALALGGVGVEVARIAAAAPRPAGAAGLAPLVRHLFPGPHVLALAAFAGYSLLVYRRRAVAPRSARRGATAGERSSPASRQGSPSPPWPTPSRCGSRGGGCSPRASGAAGPRTRVLPRLDTHRKLA